MSLSRGSRSYLELIRPANVATALADVLAGFAVAGLTPYGSLPWLLVSTACLYAGGVALNDFFDRGIDAIERPERPIPSGRVPPERAAALGAALLLAGVITAFAATPTAGLVAAATALSVLVYDAWGKRHPVVGPVNMGICRGLNLLLGVAASQDQDALRTAWSLGVLPTAYITAVTALSRGEVQGGRRRVSAFALISLILVLVALLLVVLRGRAVPVGLVFVVVLGWRVLPPFWQAYRTPAPGPIRVAIKAGVLSLVFLDAAIGAAYGGALYSVLIVVTAFVAVRLARLFPVT
jgi:4-hydroxybenzoate polyprenyltransferase